MKKTIGIRKAVNILREIDNIAVFMHMRPDFDTLGSAMALEYILKRAGKNVCIVCPDELKPRYTLICKDTVLDLKFKPDACICVDMAEPYMLGKYEEEYGKKILLSIDHHKTNSLFAKYTYLRAEASSAGEIMYDFAKAFGCLQDKTLAEYLYCAISSDSGCFKFSNASPKTHIIAAELLKTEIDHAYLDRMMLDIRTKSQLELEKLCIDTLEYRGGGKIVIMVVTLDMCEKSGADVTDVDALVQLPRTIEGAEVGISVKEQEKCVYKVSVRSNDTFDAAAFAALYGGGGHTRAAGFKVVIDNLQALCDDIALKAEAML